MKSGFLILLFLPLGIGCYPHADQIAELQERQTELEQKMDKLSEHVESALTVITRDIERLENNQFLLAGEIETIQKKNITLRRKIEKVTGDTDNPNGKNSNKASPNETYTMAVNSYNQGKYEDAILEYQKFIDTNPKDKRVPAAYLKQGLALMNLGRKEEAKFFFNTLLAKYPSSKEAKIARDKLRTIQ